jgi:hypothetical protein
VLHPVEGFGEADPQISHIAVKDGIVHEQSGLEREHLFLGGSSMNGQSFPLSLFGHKHDGHQQKIPARGPPASFLAAVAFAACLLAPEVSLAQTVTASSQTPSPSPGFAGQPISTSLSAKDTNPPSPPYGCTLGAASWSWKIVTVQYSTDGVSWGSSPGGDSEAITQKLSTSPDATLSATFPAGVPGYWNVSCQATVTYTDSPCADKWSASGSTTSSMTAVTVTILRKLDGGADYTAANLSVATLVGQYIDLKADVQPAGTTGAFQWTIPDKNFFDYEADKSDGILYALLATFLQSQTVQFYWVDSGNKLVSCKVTSGAARFETLLNGTKQHWNNNGDVAGGFVLDTDWPYKGPFVTGDLAGTSDSPGSLLDNTINDARVGTKAAPESFEMYVMFMPPGNKSRWVPLQVISWNWYGEAKWDANNKAWNLTSGGQSVNPALVTTTHPQWTLNMFPGKMVPD